ncbi:hypothetical protein VCR15J5_620090 [Vibrio crassostreae]|nr:hypothetical protein VCR15J5_620090 [Vibrio crassostreae]
MVLLGRTKLYIYLFNRKSRAISHCYELCLESKIGRVRGDIELSLFKFQCADCDFQSGMR